RRLTPGVAAKALRAPLLKTFPPALLGRIVTIPYYPLSDAVLGQIIRLQLGRITARIQMNHGAELAYGDDVVKLIAARCTEPESGGRMIDAIVTNTLLPAISRELLNRISEGHGTHRIGVSVAADEFAYTYDSANRTGKRMAITQASRVFELKTPLGK